MKICEVCGREHDGSYGSGRFCSNNCKCTYTRSKRIENLLPGGKCQFCGKECKNRNSLRNHERVCKLNPNRQAIETWTKHTHLTVNQKQKWLDAVRQGQIKRHASYKPILYKCPYCGREKNDK